ncbi:hypothetical protein JB92DRAFT_3117897 [Gautieria morchelliformis]|nr:hypothetical protein JB92DRAFT_3117897 [Gautieria morchelliformis]
MPGFDTVPHRCFAEYQIVRYFSESTSSGLDMSINNQTSYYDTEDIIPSSPATTRSLSLHYEVAPSIGSLLDSEFDVNTIDVDDFLANIPSLKLNKNENLSLDSSPTFFTSRAIASHWHSSVIDGPSTNIIAKGLLDWLQHLYTFQDNKPMDPPEFWDKDISKTTVVQHTTINCVPAMYPLSRTMRSSSSRNKAPVQPSDTIADATLGSGPKEIEDGEVVDLTGPVLAPEDADTLDHVSLSVDEVEGQDGDKSCSPSCSPPPRNKGKG